MKPLNGEKTRPLRPGSIAVLRRLALGPIRAEQISPGVRDRLAREGLATEESRGVFPSSRARQWEITAAGRARLAEIDAGLK